MKIADNLPTGAITMYCSDTPPVGWLICNGASLLRVGIYAPLFEVLGTNYGSVDADHFNIPDLRGVVPVGKNVADADFTPLGKTGGAKAHLHSVDIAAFDSGAVVEVGGPQMGAGAVFTDYRTHYHSINPPATNSNDGSSLQPYLALNFIIKILGVPEFHYA